MRWPSPRFTVRRALILVAVVAVVFGIAREFSEGPPPRFVVRDIPRRIGNLRPGMTREQARAVLGLDRSWLRGGMGATPGGFDSTGHMRFESYYVRKPRMVQRSAKIAGGPSQPIQVYLSTGMIHLSFRIDPRTDVMFQDKGAHLVKATFSGDGRTIAEMPKPPRAAP